MIIFGHKRREANGEAQGLAKMATPENLCTTLELGCHVCLDDPPKNPCIV
jgi:hypothetical protein